MYTFNDNFLINFITLLGGEGENLKFFLQRDNNDAKFINWRFEK